MNVQNLVGEIAVIDGFNNIQLGGALSDGRAFAAAYTDGANEIPVKIEQLDHYRNVMLWEYCLCTFQSVGNILIRNNTVLSSNNNNPIFFQAGFYKRVFVFLPADVILDNDNSVLFTPQTLNTSQQNQARSNIKAALGLTPFLFPGASTIWTINHNLGRPLPPFRILDSFGSQIIAAAIDQPGFNTTTINFNSPQSGGVYFT